MRRNVAAPSYARAASVASRWLQYFSRASWSPARAVRATKNFIHSPRRTLYREYHLAPEAVSRRPGPQDKCAHRAQRDRRRTSCGTTCACTGCCGRGRRGTERSQSAPRDSQCRSKNLKSRRRHHSGQLQPTAELAVCGIWLYTNACCVVHSDNRSIIRVLR